MWRQSKKEKVSMQYDENLERDTGLHNAPKGASSHPRWEQSREVSKDYEAVFWGKYSRKINDVVSEETAVFNI